jgi:indole-3-glycerol phosphate synthase/phosphoribosylanthranilate isomerase
MLYGRVKVCGLTRPGDAQVAYGAGAVWGGLILAPESPRRLEVERAAEVAAAEPGLRWAGVFVNESPERVGEIARALSLAAVQLHGEEGEETLEETRACVPRGCEVWKAVRVRESIPHVARADRILLDAFVKDARGGTGRTFDWLLLEGVSDRSRLIVSGGLTPARAAAADGLGAWALDVNSGVESGPGIKSAARLHEFFAALRGRSEAGR